jgi:hypothetical protein
MKISKIARSPVKTGSSFKVISMRILRGKFPAIANPRLKL